VKNNDIALPGFTITIKPVTEKNAKPGEMPIAPDQFASKISDFIKSRLLTNNNDIKVRLSIESWDETFDLEESIYDIHLDSPTNHTNNYTRNYWIEIERK